MNQQDQSRKLTDRDLVTAVIEQANVVHKDYGSGIIRRIEIAPDVLLIEFQDADGYYYENADSAEEFEWAEGFEDYGDEHTKPCVAGSFGTSVMLKDGTKVCLVGWFGDKDGTGYITLICAECAYMRRLDHLRAKYEPEY